MERERIKINKIIGWGALFILGIFYFCYSVFYSDFSKLNIKLPFLNFPIFIGEILLGICIAFFIIKYMTNQIPFERWHCLLLAYIAFILIKASWGYLKWGPLALRHAALFYYFLFTVVGHYLINRNLLRNNFVYGTVLFILSSAAIFYLVRTYFLYTYLILIFLLILEIKHRLLRYTAFLLLAIIFPFKLLVIVPRAVLVAEAVALLFLIVSLFFIIRVRMKYKVLFSLALLSIFAFFVYSFTRKTDIKSLIFPRITLNQYRRFARVIEATKDKVKSKENIPVHLYDKNKSGLALHQQLFLSKIGIGQQKSNSNQLNYTERAPVKKEKQNDFFDDNIVWRIFVWRDMLQELFSNGRNIWGLDFGKPFHSKSAEIIKLDIGDNVGWLEPHNSYIHILYRSGIIGFVFILIVWGLFFKMAYSFLRNWNLTGILLSSTVLFWLIIANFAVILELPYFAIPFWSLFGLTYRYHNKTGLM